MIASIPSKRHLVYASLVVRPCLSSSAVLIPSLQLQMHIHVTLVGMCMYVHVLYMATEQRHVPFPSLWVHTWFGTCSLLHPLTSSTCTHSTCCWYVHGHRQRHVHLPSLPRDSWSSLCVSTWFRTCSLGSAVHVLYVRLMRQGKARRLFPELISVLWSG